MFDYALPGGLPSGSRTVWSQTPLQPLVAQHLSTVPALTPFSYSVLAEIAGRAWYQYFDRLGFEPLPRARVLRQYQGRPYMNLTLSAQRDAEQAGLEPLTLHLNGQWFPLCKWEKPGFLGGFKANLNQKKIDDTLKKLIGEMGLVSQKAKQWHAKIQELRWTQAEILQVMEEIEHVAVPAFMNFFAARYNLEVNCNRLLRLTMDKLGYPANLGLIGHATSDINHMPEQDIAARLAMLGDMAITDPATMAWLEANAFAYWQQTLPHPPLTAALTGFLELYGHRCIGEGEIRSARWWQDPAPVFRYILAYTNRQAQASTQPSAAQSEQSLLEAVEAGQRKEAQALLQKLRQLLPLQSEALHAFAYILDGTRRWALAAAREAMTDQRLLQLDDVFFFELEEIKEMMTGEWNISAQREIQTVCTERKVEYAQWQQTSPPELLIGETETRPQAPDPASTFANLWALVEPT